MSNNPLYNQLLQRVFAEQPELAQYAELFKEQMESDDGADEVQELKTRLRKMIATAKYLKEERDDALDELDELAQALGACHECWGSDNRCPTCRGEGKAGYFKPDRKLFDELILPALSKVSWLEIKEK